MEKSKNRLYGLSGAFFNLAIGSYILDTTMTSMIEGQYKEERTRIRKLKRRGIMVIDIRDKGSIETYHPYEGMLEQLEKFVKRNNKWTLEESKYNKIKTGKYILTRVYRDYYKKKDEEDVCECCGREL